MSHPLRVRGLKHKLSNLKIKSLMSHPLRVRGLKPILLKKAPAIAKSHPLRVRGLKQNSPSEGVNYWCRILYGCVD